MRGCNGHRAPSSRRCAGVGLKFTTISGREWDGGIASISSANCRPKEATSSSISGVRSQALLSIERTTFRTANAKTDPAALLPDCVPDVHCHQYRILYYTFVTLFEDGPMPY